MPLEKAEWQDVLKVLHESYKIWSPGLDRSRYYFYNWRQLGHPWSRQNCRFLILRSNKRIVAGCKLYTVDMRSRGKHYRFAGVGAIYTMEAERGLGFGKRLMSHLSDLSRQENCHAIYLFSDIGPDFYSKFGYRKLSGREFRLGLVGTPGEEAGAARRLAPGDWPFLERHYQRWLARQSYGLDRSSPGYWQLKIWKELYLHRHSKWNWPRLEMVVPAGGDGYALIEQGGETLRLLEMVGSEPARRLVWEELTLIARSRNCSYIRAWESLRPDWLKIDLKERDWGLPMILPLKRTVESWIDTSPCPLLELDHL